MFPNEETAADPRMSPRPSQFSLAPENRVRSRQNTRAMPALPRRAPRTMGGRMGFAKKTRVPAILRNTMAVNPTAASPEAMKRSA